MSTSSDSARQNWRRQAVADTSGKELTYGRTLAGAAGAWRQSWKLAAADQAGRKSMSGVLLPPSVGGVLTNLALIAPGQDPGQPELHRRRGIPPLGRCPVRHHHHHHLAGLPGEGADPAAAGGDDPAGGYPPHHQRNATSCSPCLKARLLPARLLCAPGRLSAPTSVATVIFSSGSTGEPKGVMLTHHNIMSNIEALRMVFRVNLNDNICSALPFFHSLGFTGTLWFPLVSGFSAAYHPNPMDGEKIAQVVREHRSTLLLATPTFLLAYLRRAKKEDFATLRLVITGAEKLKAKVADAFQEKFGIRPLEGYGATELSPVITLSLPDVEIDGVRQHGSKEGSVGHPDPRRGDPRGRPGERRAPETGRAGADPGQGAQRHARLPGAAPTRPPR